MSKQRFTALLIAAVLAISGALYLSARRNAQRETQGAALLPSLAGELNTVTSLSVRRGSATPTVTVHEKDGRWTIAERGDYPADVSKLRKLLQALSEAKIVEQKTSKRTSFAIIGVEDPGLPGAAGAEILVTAQDGKHAVIIGKPIGEGNFARRSSEETSYSVEPAISFETEPRYWIDSMLIDISAGTIQSVDIKPSAQPAYTVRRGKAAVGATDKAASASDKATIAAAKAANAADKSTDAANAADTFTLEGVPPGRKAADPASLAPSPTALSSLTADDVTPASDVDFSKATVATVTLSDGNVLTLTGATVGDKHWIQLQASKDAALDAKTAGRAFEIAAYRFDAIFRPLEQLLVPKPPPPGAAKGTASSNAAGPKPAASPVPTPKKKLLPAPTP
jgi:hypothetical protein